MGCMKIFGVVASIGLAIFTAGASLLASPLAMASIGLSTLGALTGNKFLSLAGVAMGAVNAGMFGKIGGIATSSAADTAANAGNASGAIDLYKSAEMPGLGLTEGLPAEANLAKDIGANVTDLGGYTNALSGTPVDSGGVLSEAIKNPIDSIIGGGTNPSDFSDTTTGISNIGNPALKSGFQPADASNLATGNQVADATNLTQPMDLTKQAGANITNLSPTDLAQAAQLPPVKNPATGLLEDFSTWAKKNHDLLQLGGGLLKGLSQADYNDKLLKLYNARLALEQQQYNTQQANANTVISVPRLINDSAPNLYAQGNPGLMSPRTPINQIGGNATRAI